MKLSRESITSELNSSYHWITFELGSYPKYFVGDDLSKAVNEVSEANKLASPLSSNKNYSYLGQNCPSHNPYRQQNHFSPTGHSYLRRLSWPTQKVYQQKDWTAWTSQPRN